jgi:hypothetical protein
VEIPQTKPAEQATMKQLIKFLGSLKGVIVIYFLIFLLVTLHRLLISETSFNNFDIFRYSFIHLLQGENLYLNYDNQYFDLYKYSPAFAFLMAPFWWLPRIPGVFLWNWLNALLPLLAIKLLPLSEKQQSAFGYFILIEMITSAQNAQSNGLMLGLMIFGFASLENKKPLTASLSIALGFILKLFSAVLVLMAPFYKASRKMLLASAAFSLLFFFIPIIITGPEQLWQHYTAWFELLIGDKPHELNYSFRSLFNAVFGLQLPNRLFLFIGFITMILPLFRVKARKNFFWRLAYFALLLNWVVIFNHKAESPSYVIAMAGAWLWFISYKQNTFRISLLVFIFLLTGLSATDLFPETLREIWIKPFALKALPCVVLYFVTIFELLSKKYPDPLSKTKAYELR